jgi:hypothetical protein
MLESRQIIPETDAANRTFDLSSYGKGVYILKVESREGTFTKKVVIY